MRRVLVLGTVIGVAAVSMLAFGQAPTGPSAKAIEATKIEKVKENLYIITGSGASDQTAFSGGNTAVFITAKGVVVVDTKNPGWGQPIIDKIKTLTDKPVTTIINTHTHGDHVSGNVEFPPTVDVIVQENTKKYMEQANPVYGLQTTPPDNIFTKNGGRGLPKRTFKDTWTIGSGKEQIDLRYFGPAHTGGDAFVIFRDYRVMHVGDTMPTRDFPIMDKNNGGTGVGYSATIAKAAAVKNVDTIINGHNATTTTPADLKRYSEFLADFVKFVQDAKKAGKTVDDVVSTWKTPAKYSGYAQPTATRVKADAQVIWDETK